MALLDLLVDVIGQRFHEEVVCEQLTQQPAHVSLEVGRLTDEGIRAILKFRVAVLSTSSQVAQILKFRSYKYVLSYAILETATRRCPGCMASTILSNWLDFRFQSKVGLFCTFSYLQLYIYLLTYMGVKTPI